MTSYQLQDSRFKCTFIASHEILYNIQHGHISMHYKYQHKYRFVLSREVEIPRDLWTLWLFNIYQVYFNWGTKGAAEKITENGIICNHISTARVTKPRLKNKSLHITDSRPLKKMNPLMYALILTIDVREPSYLGLIMSISWLLMPWLITSPRHQQPWYWLCRMGSFLSYLRKGFIYMFRINAEKWHKM